MNASTRRVWLPVFVGALGYFVDIYDLVLFSIVRVQSLQSLGVPEASLLSVGVMLLNSQMVGMLVGGVVWGVLGDKKGRLSILFGSILLYSVANLANAFVESVTSYAVWRFIAGVGLAGELGAAVTLVSEILPKQTRGYGTTIVAAVGVTGAIAAGLTGDWVGWRAAYAIGGVMGLGLLVLRIGIFESGLFKSEKVRQARRGDLVLLFQSTDRIRRFVACVLIGVPIWFVVSVPMTFAPEFAQALGIQGTVTAGRAILYCYAGLSIGDLLTGVLSQILRTRRRVIAFSLMGLSCLILLLSFRSDGISAAQFYLLSFCFGIFSGYWAIFITVAAELFGTNLRATVATSVPNLVRGSAVFVTLYFEALTGSFGVLSAGLVVGVTSVALALTALFFLDETYGKDLDFIEQ